MSSQTKITVVLDSDDTKLIASLQRVAQASGATSVQVSKIGESSGAGIASLRSGFDGLSQTVGQLGLATGPVSLVFQSLDSVFDRTETSAKSLGGGLQVAGAGLLAFGALSTALGAKEQANQAGLKQAIANTGQSYDQYSSQIDQTVSSQAKLGNNANDVYQALTVMTTASGSASTALSQMGLVADLAAFKNESLATASQQVANVLSGRFTAVQGIVGTQYKDITDSAAELTKAQKEQASATDEQTTANQRLADVQQQIQASQATAQQNLSDLQARLTQSQQDDQQKAAAVVTTADENLATAQQNLLDVQQQLADQASESLSQAHDLADAQTALANVQERIAAGQLSGLDAQQQLQAAQSNLSYIKAQQDAQHQASATEQEDLQKKTQAVAAAQAADDAAKAKAAAAGKLTLAQSQELAKAQQAAAGPSVSQQQDLVKAQEAVAKANSDAAKATRDLQKAQSDQAANGTKIQQVLAALQDKTNGDAQAKANTLKGQFDSFLAQMENSFSDFGQKYGSLALGVGAVLEGVGTLSKLRFVAPLIEGFGDVVSGFFTMDGAAAVFAGVLDVALGPIGLIIAAIAGLALGAYELYEHWDTVSHALDVAWHFIENTAITVFTDVWHFLERWGPLILTTLAPVIGLPLLIWQHWSTITGFVSQIFGDVLNFLEGIPGKIDNLAVGMWDGISDEFITVINLLISAWDTFTSYLKIPSFTVGYGPVKYHFSGWNPGSSLQIAPISARAAGGPVQAGMPYVVGENEPELFVPDSNGTILPSVPRLSPQAIAMTQAGGLAGANGATIEIKADFTGAVIADQRSLQTLGDALSDAVHEALLRKQRSGNDLKIKATTSSGR